MAVLEDGEEGIALASHDPAAAVPHGGPDDVRVRGVESVVARAEGPHVLHRALDIRPKKGDGPNGQSGSSTFAST